MKSSTTICWLQIQNLRWYDLGAYLLATNLESGTQMLYAIYNASEHKTYFWSSVWIGKRRKTHKKGDNEKYWKAAISCGLFTPFVFILIIGWLTNLSGRTGVWQYLLYRCHIRDNSLLCGVLGEKGLKQRHGILSSSSSPVWITM